MSCRVSRSRLAGEITCPASKSYTHRAVFVASLAKGGSRIENVLRSADTDATIRACRSFGADIDDRQSVLEIRKDAAPVRPSKIDVANSGTTIRIAAAIAGLCEGGTSTLTGDASIRRRPMQPLLDALEALGARCSSNSGMPPITVKGRISGGELRIPGNVSSQFVTAVLIVAPLTESGVTLEIDGDLVSKPYLDATVATMRKFGVEVRTAEQYKKYSVGRQEYKGTRFAVPSDASSLALLLSAAVLVGHGLAIKAKPQDLPQGDMQFLDILEGLGVKVSVDGGSVTVQPPQELAGGSFDLGNTPDLLPPLSILALKSKKPIEAFNVGHARLKETDRIKIISRELRKTGLEITERADGMTLEKKSGELVGADFDSEGDHRLFMAFCIAGMHLGRCTVTSPESVAVSYPDFISEINGVGGKIDTLSHKEL